MLRYLSSLPFPTTFTSLVAANRTVDVNVLVNVAGEEEQKVRLRDVSVPIQYDDLVHRLNQLGYHNCDPNVFFATNTHEIEITSGKSSFDFANGGQINLDETFLHYYTNLFRPEAYPNTKDWTSNSLLTDSKIVQDEKIEAGGLVRIGFQRTIRAPDNKKVYALPPDMGSFKLFNTSDLVDNLPQSVVSKGGVCISMYQQEALWISFSPIKPCAVKVSVGGVNALTGAPSDSSIPRKQDYIALSDDRSRQLWLDGIAVAPCVTRQFVAIPLEQGKTVKGQITGHETGGDIQFDVFPLYPTDVCFRHGGAELDIFKTPRQLGLSVDDYISMENTGIPPTILSPTNKSFRPVTGSISLPLKVNMERAVPSGCYVIVTLTGKHLVLPLESSDTIAKVKASIEEKEDIPHDQQLLMYGGRLLEDNQTLSDYDIQPGSKIFLRLMAGSSNSHPRGGIGVGARISQKIANDPLPIAAYDPDKTARLNVTIINASHFTASTGLPPSPTPVDERIYERNRYPWLELYDERVPVVDEGSILVDAPSLSAEKAVESAPPPLVACAKLSSGCVCCLQASASIVLRPCGHTVCKGCSCVTTCPSCEERVMDRTEEAKDAMDYSSLEKRMERLRLNAGSRNVTSFKLKSDGVSPLTSGHRLR